MPKERKRLVVSIVESLVGSLVGPGSVHNTGQDNTGRPEERWAMGWIVSLRGEGIRDGVVWERA